MIGVGLAMIVVGIILLFMLPWVGIAVGIVGIVLFVLWLAGIGRSARSDQATSRRV
jgi:Flp pilus assembly protein TadB